jgi:hypothetical protein
VLKGQQLSSSGWSDYQASIAMIFPRHPKPVVPAKAVATQVVQQKQDGKIMDKNVLIIPAGKPSAPPLPPAKE